MEIEDKKRRRFTKVTIGLLSISALAIGGIFVAEFRNPDPDIPVLLHDIFLSIFCSVAASAIYALLQVAVSRDEQEELKALKEKVENMDSKLRMQNELYDSGIVSIRRKSYYDPNGRFWRTAGSWRRDTLSIIVRIGL